MRHLENQSSTIGYLVLNVVFPALQYTQIEHYPDTLHYINSRKQIELD